MPVGASTGTADMSGSGGCGASLPRRIDQCECHLPPGHPPPHRCGDCGLEWFETARSIAAVRRDHGDAGAPGAGGQAPSVGPA